jgi:hypothetical protein
MRHTSKEEDRSFVKLLAEELITFDASVVLKWVADNFEPDEIYDHGELNDWAENNGYVNGVH